LILFHQPSPYIHCLDCPTFFSNILSCIFQIPERNCLLIGVWNDKSLKNFCQGQTTGEYIGKRTVKDSIKEFDIHRLKFNTSVGPVIFNMFEFSSQMHVETDHNLQHGHCAILLFDVTCRLSYKNVPNWYRDVQRVCGNIPLALVGSNIEVKDRQIKANQITFHKKKKIPYYDAPRSNFEEPFLLFARHPKLDLISKEALHADLVAAQNEISYLHAKLTAAKDQLEATHNKIRALQSKAAPKPEAGHCTCCFALTAVSCFGTSLFF